VRLCVIPEENETSKIITGKSYFQLPKVIWLKEDELKASQRLNSFIYESLLSWSFDSLAIFILVLYIHMRSLRSDRFSYLCWMLWPYRICQL